MLTVQFVDADSPDDDSPIEIALLENANHSLPPVGAEVVTYNPVGCWVVVSVGLWSLSAEGMFVRVELRKRKPHNSGITRVPK